MKYEMEFVLAAVNDNPFYRKRLNDFKEIGLMNIPKNVRVRVMLLLEQGTFGNKIDKGWSCDVVVEQYPVGQHVNKLCRHYLEMMTNRNFQSKWYITIDDDSVTNVGGLYDVLSSYNHVDPIYFSTPYQYYYGHISDEIKILHELDGVQLLGDNWDHDWESNYISRMALIKMLDHPFVKKYLQYRKNKDGYSDQFLAYAARIANVPIYEATFSSPLAMIKKFSLLGGSLHHIHYVSHDYHNTARFKKMARKINSLN